MSDFRYIKFYYGFGINEKTYCTSYGKNVKNSELNREARNLAYDYMEQYADYIDWAGYVEEPYFEWEDISKEEYYQWLRDNMR